MPDVLDARGLQPIEDVHQILILHAAVAAQEHLLVGCASPSSAGCAPAGRRRESRSLSEVDDAVLRDRSTGTSTNDALAGDLRCDAARDRQVHVDAALHHRRGDHEDDQQHEHHVDQRHDVDLGERASARAGRGRTAGAGAGGWTATFGIAR